MVVPQLKKDTARRFNSYLFCGIYTVYHKKKWNAIEKMMNWSNRTKHAEVTGGAGGENGGINLNALAMAPGVCEGEKAGKYGLETA